VTLTARESQAIDSTPVAPHTGSSITCEGARKFATHSESSGGSALISEGVGRRELKGFIRGVQEACARLDIEKALAIDPAEDAETGEDHD
jgi:hypothetical protein